MKKYYIFIAILGSFCALAVGYQIVISRAPAADSKVVQDLNAIDAQINSYAQKSKRLPASLEDADLVRDLANRSHAYTYSVVSNSKYKICAIFATDASIAQSSSVDDPSYHGKGKQCFNKEVYSLVDYSYPKDDVLSPTPPSPTSILNTICTAKIVGILLSDQPVVNAGASNNDPSSGTMVAGPSANARLYQWSKEKPVGFDANCRTIDISAVKSFDTVDLIYTTNSNPNEQVLKAFKKH